MGRHLSPRLLFRYFDVHERRHAVRDADRRVTALGRSLAPVEFLMYDFRTLNVDLLEVAMSELADRIKAALEDF
jgi:hypothetical protein